MRNTTNKKTRYVLTIPAQLTKYSQSIFPAVVSTWETTLRLATTLSTPTLSNIFTPVNSKSTPHNNMFLTHEQEHLNTSPKNKFPHLNTSPKNAKYQSVHILIIHLKY